MGTDVAAIMAEVDRLGQVDTLRDLRVTDLRFIPLSHRFPPGEEQIWSGGVLPGVTAGLVEVSTSDGIVGYGETYAGTFAPEVVAALVRHFAPAVVGTAAGAISQTWQRCYTGNLYWGRSGVAVSTLSAIEMALWDVCGKALGRPVHELLGSGSKDRVACYASGGMDKPDSELGAELRGYVDRGFGGTKIRVGHRPDLDAARVAAARTAVGDSFPLAVDAVQGSNPRPWSAEEAVAAGRAMSEYGPLWLEELCAAVDVEGYVECRRRLSVPIAGGETLTTAREFIPFLEAGAFDIVQPDASHTGGLLEALKVARLAEHYGVATAMHVWGSGVCFMGNAHVAFAASTCDWLEYPTIPNPLVEELRAEVAGPKDGQFLRPELPGLGVTVSAEAVARYRYEAGNQYRFQNARS